MSGTVEVPVADQIRALRKIEQVLRHALSDIRDEAKKRAEYGERSFGRAPGYRRIEGIAEDGLNHRQGIMNKAKMGYAHDRGAGLENWGVKP